MDLDKVLPPPAFCTCGARTIDAICEQSNPDGVREEVRFLIDTFDRPDGGLCIAAGNGIVSGTPIDNIQAFLEEALDYGQQHRSRFTRQRIAK